MGTRAPAPVVAVASGKGGVGKTTVAVNLALALAAGGLSTGLVDADLYGPDVPRMLGLRREARAGQLTLSGAAGTPGARLQAVSRHGLQVASAAFLLGEGQGVGLAAGLAQLLVRRLLEDTEWAPGTSCLVVDLPPGTADVQQFVFALRRRVSVLLVLTPQAVAHSDARRLVAVLRRRQARILGGVENFAGLACAHCGQVSPMFPDAPAGDSVWGEVERLCALPFSPQAAAQADAGMPVMLTRAVGEQVAAYEALAARVRAGLD